MKLRKVGKSGLDVSVIGLGCNNFGWRIDQEATRKVVHKALDLGINLFDTADIYDAGKSETYLGEILGSHRQNIVLATKFGMPVSPDDKLHGGSRRYIMASVEGSLRRLKTDWIDLYQFHQPDPRTPIEETLRALDDLVHQGKVRYIGCSNMPAWQVTAANWTSTHHNLNRFVSCQDEYNLLWRHPEKELIPMAIDQGMGLLPYYPLAGGLLTGKYAKNAGIPDGARLGVWTYLADKYMTPDQWSRVEHLQAIKRPLLEVAMAWLLSKPVVCSVIAGATRSEQLEANVKAAEATFSADELAAMDKATGTG